MRKLILSVLLMVLVLPLAAQEDERLNVVVTFSILGDVVQNVAGDAADVTVIMPIDADPHSYDPTPRDIAAMVDADVVISNGMNFEETLIPVIEAQGDEINHVVVSSCVPVREFEPQAHDDHSHEGDDDHSHEGDDDHMMNDPCHDAMKSLEDVFGHTPSSFAGTIHYEDCEDVAHDHDDEGDHDHEHGACDPHLWMDPHNVVLWTYTIRDTLSALDPANADIYAANADAYVETIAPLANMTYASLETIPQENRVLISNHLSFGYLTTPTDFNLVAAIVPGGSTLGDVSAADLAVLVEAVNDTGVPAIFAENTVSPQLVDQIAAETGVDVAILYTGSLSAADGPTPTYADFITYNVTTIVTALGGEVVMGEPIMSDHGDMIGDHGDMIGDHGDMIGDHGDMMMGGAVSAAYMVIANNGDADDTLVAAATDAANVVEIHESVIDENDVMRMNQVSGITVSAGGEATLRQGGYHVMLIDLTRNLNPGDTIDLTLNFESGLTVDLQVPVVELPVDVPETTIEAGSISVINPWVRAAGTMDDNSHHDDHDHGD